MSQFDKLIHGLLSREVMEYLSGSGVTGVTLQTGATAIKPPEFPELALTVETYQYKPSLAEVRR